MGNELVDAQKILNTKILPQLLPICTPSVLEDKVIHDNLLESCVFEGWEIGLLDTPLLQRLRYIHQLGTAFFTYPSAVHTRFSHTLGVAVLAGTLYDTLATRTLLSSLSAEEKKNERATVRLAALLHDVGHTFFSHCSERVTSHFWSGIIKDLDLGVKPKAHEFIAYLIVTSDYFKNYWNAVICPESYGIDQVDLNLVGKIIIGDCSDPSKAYLTDILNGQYDVDKLEYLNRDAKAAGLPIAYDKARYFLKIDLFEKEGKKALIMGQGGIQCVEQMALGKIMLFPYVYQHHKVLATDALVHDLVVLLLSHKEAIKGIEIEHPLDLLLYTDCDLLGLSATSEISAVQNLLMKLRTRNLPKRAFIVHREYVENNNNSTVISSFLNFQQDCKNLAVQHQMRQKIADILTEEVGREVAFYDIHITRPNFIGDLSSMNSAPVLTKSGECVEVNTMWILSGWSDSHASKTDYTYFHVPSDLCKDAYGVIQDYLISRYKLEFKQILIAEHCKLEMGS